MFASFLTSRLWMTCDRTGLLINTMKSGVGIGNLSVYVIMFLKLPLEFFVFVRIQNFILHDQLAGRIFHMPV
jgi:hypothetical protein